MTSYEEAMKALKRIDEGIDRRDERIREQQITINKQKELLDRCYQIIALIESQCWAAEHDGYEMIPVQSVKASLRRRG